MASQGKNGETEVREKDRTCVCLTSGSHVYPGTVSSSTQISEFEESETHDSENDLVKTSYKFHPILGYLFEGHIPLRRQKEFIQQLQSCENNSDNLQTQLQTEYPAVVASRSDSEVWNASTTLKTAQSRFTYLNIPSNSNVELSLSTDRDKKKRRVPQIIDQQGWKWRKQGQKVRKGGNIRSYYRCSMRSSGCLAALIVNKNAIPSSGNVESQVTIWDARGSHNHEPPAASNRQVHGVEALAEPLGITAAEKEVPGSVEHFSSTEKIIDHLGVNDRGDSFFIEGDDNWCLLNGDRYEFNA